MKKPQLSRLFEQSPLLLLLSTAALSCLSLSVGWHFTIGLAILWFCLYAHTLRSAKKQTNPESSVPDSTRSYFAAFILVILFFNFFYTLSTGKPLEIMLEIGFPQSLVTPLILMLGALGSIVGYPAMCVYARYFVPLYYPIRDVLKKMHKQYLVLAIVYLVGLIAILRANFYFTDDLGRNVEGYSLTGDFSRYAASYLATVLHGGGWLTDISPLPQILAALIMALAAVITLYVISESREFRIMDMVCLVPFGLSPYFLECFAYKYDAPYMAFSVLAAVYPLLYRHESTKKYVISVALSTMLVCTTYQVSAGVFPLCVAFLCFLSWNKGDHLKVTFSFLFKSAAAYTAGVLFFRYVLMDALSDGNYVGSSVSLRCFPENIHGYFTRIMEDFNLIWLLLFVLVAVSFLVAACAATKRRKLPAFFMSLFTLLVVFCLSNGLYSFFRQPLTSARSMYGFGILLALLSWYIVTNSKLLLSRASVCLLAWLMFAFCFTYGNALYSQQEYANFRNEQIISDLSKLELVKDKSTKLVAVSGDIGFAESVDNMLHVYPIMPDLVPVLLCDTDWHWGAYRLLHYYDLDHLIQDKSGLVKAQDDLTLLVDSYYHRISGNENYILIELLNP